jgi:hypothetical protein
VTDVEILAKQTHEVAVRKKNCTGAMGAYQRRFLAEMRVVAGNPGLLCGFTYPRFTGNSVYATSTRAKVARVQNFISCLYLFSQ